MKFIHLISLLLIVTLPMHTAKAAPVDLHTAQTVALTFMQGHPGYSTLQRSDIRLAFTSAQLEKSEHNAFYAFHTGSHGFVIVSANDDRYPILAYSTTSSLTLQSMPDHIREMFSTYHDRTQATAEKHSAEPAVTALWDLLASGQVIPATQSANEVRPLIETTWNQSPYYNKFCPYDSNAYTNAVTGCVATAMAQLIRYWKYPERGFGSCAYTHYKYGYLETHYDKTYQYDSMPIALNGYSSTAQVDAVARLMSDCGVGVGMGYSPTGSGSQVLEEDGKEYSAEYVLRNNFGYVNGEGCYKYTTLTTWYKNVKNDLDNGRPILFRGTKLEDGGHCFICDGYDGQGLYHFNWGWGGQMDGYYLLDSAYGFNIYQGAIFHLMPPYLLNTYHLVLYSDLQTSSDTLYCGQDFSIQVDVLNNGGKPFSGYFRLCLLNGQSMEVVNVFDTVSCLQQPLTNGSHFSTPLTFRGNMQSLNTANYVFRLFYKDTTSDLNQQEWIPVTEIGDFRNTKSIRFEGGQSNTHIDSVCNITANSAFVRYQVEGSCSETVILQGVQYKKSTSSSYNSVKAVNEDSETGILLTGLQASTSYDVRAYAMVQTGSIYKTIYSEKTTFVTEADETSVTACSDENIRIYPNPSDGRFFIETPEERGSWTIEVWNTLGQKVHTALLPKGKTCLSAETWPKGLYIIHLQNETFQKTEKITIR